MIPLEVLKRVTVQGRAEGLDKLQKGVQDVERTLKQLGATSAQTTTATESQAKSTLSAASAYDRMMRSLDPTYKAQRQLEQQTRAVDRALRQGAIGAEEHARAIGLINQRYDAVIADSSHLRNELTRTNHAAGQLTFQLNDVFTGLATGQSPFMIAAQQSGQISQILGANGGGLRESAALLGQAFVSMLNPINAVIIGLGVAGTAAAYFFSTSEDSSKAAEEALERHEALLARIKERYGEVAEGIGRARQESEQWLASQAGFNAEDRSKSLMGASEDFLTTTTVDVFGQNRVAEQFLVFEEAIVAFRASVQAGEPDVNALSAAIDRLKGEAEDNGRAMMDTASALVEMAAKAKEAEDMAFLTSVMSNLAGSIKAVGAEATLTADQIVSMTAAAGKHMEFMSMMLGGRVTKYATGGPSLGPDFRGPLLVGPDVLPPDRRFEVDLVNDPAPAAPRRGGGGGGGSRRDPFADAMQSAQARIQSLEQEKVALGLVGDELARYRAEQQFLNGLRREWADFSPEQQSALEAEASRIGDVAEELERAKKAQEELKEAQERADDALQNFGSSVEEIFLAFVEGGDQAKQAIAKLVAELLRAALIGGGPFAGFFPEGGLLTPSASAGAGGGGAGRAASVPKAMAAARYGSGQISTSIVVQGNADENTVAKVDQRLKAFSRDINRQMEQRESNRWRTA